MSTMLSCALSDLKCMLWWSKKLHELTFTHQLRYMHFSYLTISYDSSCPYGAKSAVYNYKEANAHSRQTKIGIQSDISWYIYFKLSSGHICHYAF